MPGRSLIRGILQNHKGKDNAITGERIAESLYIDYYDVRAIIRELVSEGCLIASGTNGYYIPITENEVSEATRSLRHRGITILVRAARLKKTSIEEIFKQARMEYFNGV